MVAVSMFSLRWWRLRCLGRSQLVRTWDRVETATLVVIALVVLVSTPFIGLLGSTVYDQQRAQAAEQSATRHETTATLIAGAIPETSSPRAISIGGTSPVPAVWTLPDGSEKTGPVPADRGATAGTKVTVWLDQTGSVVGAPITSGDAAMNAITVAMLAWLGLLAIGSGAFSLARWALDRRRFANWDGEWERIDTNRSHF